MNPTQRHELPRLMSMYDDIGRRVSFWVWLLITLALIAGFGFLRLSVFPDRFVPLTSAIALLVCLLHRDARLLWLMAGSFVAMAAYKTIAMIPEEVLATDRQVLFAIMQVSNTVIAAAVLHALFRLMNRLQHNLSQLEQANEELEVSNEELAAREEEVTQQNEELQTQAEELEQQTEELNAQTEELQTLNEQVLNRERTLSDLLETSLRNAGEGETLARLGRSIERLIGDRACAAAVLEASDDQQLTVHPLSGLACSTARYKRDRTLAGLILERDTAGCLGDTSLRPDLQMPPLSSNRAIRSVAAAPFRAGSSMRGALELYSTESGDWSEHELRIVQWLADQCGLLWTASRYEEERAQLLDSERSARADAERANRMKDEFVATLSHELRTPLNAVLGWATLLRRSGCENSAEVLKGMEVIERNARHQGRLISDLLDVSRIMAGKIRLDVQSVDLPLIVESALDSLRPAADARQVELRRQIDPVDREVTGDPSRLEQVVWNLLSNAIKFTSIGGRVNILVSRVASYVQIVISDTGMGIAADDLPHLFDRYRQVDGSATRKHGGLGLGLAICKSLVELHGGTISAHSDGEGCGSTFKVLLPVLAVRSSDDDQPHPTAATGVTDEHTSPSLDGISVLVVDDEADARELISHILEEHGAEVEVAASGSEAIERVASSPPDMLVSDIGMPGVDGYSLIRSVRSKRPDSARTLPAVALTAFARSEDRTRALLAGFQAHIAKPVEPAELVATVASLRYAMPDTKAQRDRK